MNYIINRMLATIVFALVIGCIASPTKLYAAGETKTTTTLEQKRRFSIVTTNNDESSGVQKWIMTVHVTGQKYHILDTTKISGLLGEALSMDELATPCTVEISYNQLNSGERNALAIKVKKILPGATTKWPTPIPE